MSARRIRRLSTVLANQIAAGEVVERPASVVKELVENSIDAGARAIEIDVAHGGARLVRVRDDGSGVRREDLALALDRHATSKIGSLDDLERIASMGFRGEALPSIASVSRLTLRSRAAGAEQAFEVRSDGGSDAGPPAPAAHPPGTTVDVRDLFFNTPARRRFLRTEKTEVRHVEDVVRRAALAHGGIAFRLRHNQRGLVDVRGAEGDEGLRRRLAALCGRAFAADALALAVEAQGLRLSGWLATPAFHRGRADLQYLFVNRRPVKDQVMAHALRLAHDGLLPGGRFPAAVLFLDIDAEQVDVNVHPTKHEVRFREARLVHDFLARALRGVLHGDAGLFAPPAGRVADGEAPPTPGAPSRPAGGHGGEAARAPAGPAAPAAAGATLLGRPVGHVAGTHVVALRAGGLVVVDVGAARARILATRLRAAAQEGGPARRPLLIPETVAVDESTADLAERHAGLLDALGFGLDRAGPGRVRLRSVPAALADLPGVALGVAALAALADATAAGTAPDPGALVDAILARCDLAYGQTRDTESMERLLRALEACPRRDDPPAPWRVLERDDLEAWLASGRRP